MERLRRAQRTSSERPKARKRGASGLGELGSMTKRLVLFLMLALVSLGCSGKAASGVVKGAAQAQQAHKDQVRDCKSNLKTLSIAMEMAKKGDQYPVSLDKLPKSALEGARLNSVPDCPLGGTYKLTILEEGFRLTCPSDHTQGDVALGYPQYDHVQGLLAPAP